MSKVIDVMGLTTNGFCYRMTQEELEVLAAKARISASTYANLQNLMVEFLNFANSTAYSEDDIHKYVIKFFKTANHKEK